MTHRAVPGVSLHNVAELAPPEWTDGGSQLYRVPRAVAADLNVGARERVGHPSGCELRVVPRSTATVTLSAARETRVHPFWGEFQAPSPFSIGPEPTAHEFAVPDRIARLDPAAETGAFAPQVCRLRFASDAPVAVHDVTGDCRPPEPDELPDRRYLAYGTSITEGHGISPHLTYVATAARALGADPLNLGLSGSAYCEPAIADYLVDRSDWDVATLAVSVNMANRGFTVEAFRDRVETLVTAVADAHPDAPVVAITLFPYHADVVRGDDADRAAAFRRAVRRVVADAGRGNLSLVEGPDLLDVTGLSSDVLHPGDAGQGAVGRALAARLDDLPVR